MERTSLVASREMVGLVEPVEMGATVPDVVMYIV